MPSSQKAWVVAVDMGYGHQRAAYPLKRLAFQGKVLNVNNYPGIPKEDVEIWKKSQRFYNFISRFKNVPWVGEAAFNIFDKFQSIPQFYPRRDLTRPNFQLLSTVSFIKKGWGKHFVDILKKQDIPLITTFFVPAYMAEIHGFSNDIYLLVCDADISRAWAPYKPHLSKIKYLAPNHRVIERLKLYGVPENRIFLTGFPLPLENLGNENLDTLKDDFCCRLTNLDPEGKHISKYKESLKKETKRDIALCCSPSSLSLTFAVGGAGAQRKIGVEIVKSLSSFIKEGKVRVNLIAGIRNEVNSYFKEKIRALGLGGEIGQGITIVYANTKEEYFHRFSLAIRKTDILWTKPSELSFYAALGLPIIIAPPIGSQEHFNKKWLTIIGAGIPQENPRYTNEWLFDWLKGGVFVEAAISGYFGVSKYGTFNVEKVVLGGIDKVRVEKKYLQF